MNPDQDAASAISPWLGTVLFIGSVISAYLLIRHATYNRPVGFLPALLLHVTVFALIGAAGGRRRWPAITLVGVLLVVAICPFLDWLHDRIYPAYATTGPFHGLGYLAIGVLLGLGLPIAFSAHALSAWLYAEFAPPLTEFCGKCAYNLTGNVSGRCPECGTPIANLNTATGVHSKFIDEN